jgi:hypothetical protein
VGEKHNTMSLTGVKLFFANFFDEKGDFIKRIHIDQFQPIFNFRKKAYNVIKEASYIDLGGILWDKRFYFYKIDNTNPIKFDKKVEPILEPELYNILLETETAKKLNDSHKKFNIDFKMILIILAVLGIGYYIIKNGGIM